jgi:hypothetical protein
MKRTAHNSLWIGGALALVLGIGAPATAQVTATVVTKDGERHTGTNLGYRVDEREVAVRTGQHTEPRIPVNRVAYVDFGGTPDARPNVTGTQEVIVLRNGQVHRGQVIELGHTDREDQTTEYLVSFRMEDGQERRFRANEVARVYFAGGAQAAAAQPGAQPGAQQPGAVGTTGQQRATVTIQGRQQWSTTPMRVQQGEWLTFTTTGEVRIGNGSEDVGGPAGVRNQRLDRRAPVPQAYLGALIGRIDNGQPFGIGDQTRVQMPASGQLFLGINDPDVRGNEGQFQVEIQREGGATAVPR